MSRKNVFLTNRTKEKLLKGEVGGVPGVADLSLQVCPATYDNMLAFEREIAPERKLLSLHAAGYKQTMGMGNRVAVSWKDGAVVKDQPVHGLRIGSGGAVTGDLDQTGEEALIDLPFLIDPNGSSGADHLFGLRRGDEQLLLNRRARLGPHERQGKSLIRANRHAVTATDAQCLGVLTGRRESVSPRHLDDTGGTHRRTGAAAHAPVFVNAK